jgi:hypothetical protein
VVVVCLIDIFLYSGVDVIALLESMSISEKLINPLRDSSAGYIALAYALYKIATPVRYTVTLGTLHLLFIITLEYLYNTVIRYCAFSHSSQSVFA